MTNGLFTPLQVNPSLTLKNRIVMSSLTRNRAQAGPGYKIDLKVGTVPNEPMREYYTQRAKGGTGLIMSEGTLISPQGTQWANAPGIWDHDHAEGWKKITDSVHEAGSAMFAQLWHLGRVNHPDMPQQGGRPVLGPSAIAARGGHFHDLGPDSHYETPTEAGENQIQGLLAEYRAAAAFAKQAGFDGVELHSANGYLCHQFLDSTVNHRTDKYGGSVENRARFILEALQCLIDAWGSKSVGIKLSPTGGYNDVGMPLEETIETFTYLLTEINKLDLAYVQLVQYVPMMDPKIDGELRGTQHDVLKTYKPFIKNSLLFLNGGLDAESAEKLISSGEIDAAVFGFPMINNPDFANRVKAGKPLNTVPTDFRTLYSFEKDIGEGYTTYIPEGGILTEA